MASELVTANIRQACSLPEVPLRCNAYQAGKIRDRGVRRTDIATLDIVGKQ